MKSLFTYIKTHYIISVIGAVVVVGASLATYSTIHSNNKFQTTPVLLQKITQTVEVTGTVKPSSDADLSFEKSGRVSNVYFDVGAQVKTGDTLVVLDSADLAADLLQSQAQLQKEQLKLDNLKSGNRPEDIAISQSQFDNAQSALDAANITSKNAISDSYSKADDAISYHVDKFYTNPRSPLPTLSFALNDSGLSDALQKGRVTVGLILNDIAVTNQNISSAKDLSFVLSQTITKLNSIKSFIDNLASGVNTLMVSSSLLSQTTIDGYKSDMSLARADISTAISGVTAALNARDNAISALQTAKSQLGLQKAGSTQSDIDAQVAQVQTQQGLVAIKQAALAKNYLKSPIDGIVSRQDAKVGEIAQAGVVLVSVISNSKFDIEANIPEASLSKVVIGDFATVKLDAYPDGSVFDATVIKIDPAETIVDGVPTYKVTFEFNNVDSRIKSGMTANITIISATKESAVVVSARAVFSDNQGNYVKVLKRGAEVLTRIQTGIKGSDGMIEVTAGLNVGDLVIY